MSNIWVVVADEGLARFLALPSHGEQLQPVDELTDAGAHASNAALSRDAHGRRMGRIEEQLMHRRACKRLPRRQCVQRRQAGGELLRIRI